MSTEKRSSTRRWWFWIALFSVSLNLLFFALYWFWPGESSPSEQFLFGSESARAKVAVIKIEGLLAEGLTNHALAQIEMAYKDDEVAAAVIAINSPGGTISASEQLHQQLLHLKQGDHPRWGQKKPRPMVAHFGSIAASGGYYIAMPAQHIVAEKGTITGSIGVYASFPNAVELADKLGVHMNLIKAGAIKASGSPFHEMTPNERLPWQTMVDQAYEQFLGVISVGRPKLSAEQLRNEVVYATELPRYDFKGNPLIGPKVPVQRTRADGGTFTAMQALEYGLIDEISNLDRAVNLAAELAKLPEYRVIGYARPVSYLDLIGLKARSSSLDVATAMSAQVWLLSPGSELLPMGLALQQLGLPR